MGNLLHLPTAKRQTLKLAHFKANRDHAHSGAALPRRIESDLLPRSLGRLYDLSGGRPSDKSLLPPRAPPPRPNMESFARETIQKMCPFNGPRRLFVTKVRRAGGAIAVGVFDFSSAAG